MSRSPRSWMILAALGLLPVASGCVDNSDAEDALVDDEGSVTTIESELSTTPYVLPLPYRGGSGGSPTRVSCGPNGLMVGFSARYGTYIDRVDVICRTILADGSLSPAWGAGGAGGYGGPWFRQYECPSGYAVSGIASATGTYLDRMAVYCSPLPSLPVVDPTAWYPTRVGYAGQGSGGKHHADQCRAGYAITELELRSGSWVDGIMGFCRYVQP